MPVSHQTDMTHQVHCKRTRKREDEIGAVTRNTSSLILVG